METKTKNTLLAVGIIASASYLSQSTIPQKVEATTLHKGLHSKIEKIVVPRRIQPQPLGTFTMMPEATPYMDLILKASAKYDVDPAVILAVMKNESHFNPKAKSSAGAVGLMQVLPSTATWILGISTSEVDLENPSINIEAGVAYLSYIQSRVNRFGESKQNALMFAGYNAGHGRVLKGKIPNIKETQSYVAKCIRTFHSLA